MWTNYSTVYTMKSDWRCSWHNKGTIISYNSCIYFAFLVVSCCGVYRLLRLNYFLCSMSKGLRQQEELCVCWFWHNKKKKGKKTKYDVRWLYRELWVWIWPDQPGLKSNGLQGWMECCQSRWDITTVNINFSIILHFEKLLRKNNDEHQVNIRCDSAVLVK